MVSPVLFTGCRGFVSEIQSFLVPEHVPVSEIYGIIVLRKGRICLMLFNVSELHLPKGCALTFINISEFSCVNFSKLSHVWYYWLIFWLCACSRFTCYVTIKLNQVVKVLFS